MKVAYLSAFYPLRGGIAQFNAALYRAFEKKHEIRAFNFSRQYPGILFPGKSQYVTAEDKADQIQAQAVLDTINPFTYFSAASKIRKYTPDLMLTKFWMPFFAPSLGTVFSGNKKKTKRISILDNVIPHEKRIGDIALTKYFLNQNDGFVVMSDEVKRDLLLLKPDAKFIFHPHPLYDHFGKKTEKALALRHLNIPSGKKVLLFFGFIRDYKGLDILLEALKMLDDTYVLVIAGEVYGSFAKYENYIRENKLGSKVILHTRYISDSEVTQFFSAADVCVLPYKSATQSGITSIAFHFEVPVIATDVGGLKEYISDLKTGMIVAKPEAALISEAVKNYFSENYSDKFRPYLLENKKNLSWESLAASIESFYKTL